MMQPPPLLSPPRKRFLEISEISDLERVTWAAIACEFLSAIHGCGLTLGGNIIFSLIPRQATCIRAVEDKSQEARWRQALNTAFGASGKEGEG